MQAFRWGMTVGEFINECRGKLSLIYPAEEASALARKALEDIYGISRTRQLTYPDKEITALSTPSAISKRSCIPDYGIDAVETDSLHGGLNPSDVIERLASGEPVQYISGFEHFCGSKFRVGPGVLIPRPETEELVTLIAEEIKKDFVSGDIGSTSEVEESFSPERRRAFKIFDVCTGSGCIAWSLHKKLLPYFSGIAGSEKCQKPAAKNFAQKVLETYGCDISEVALQYAKNQRVSFCRLWPMFFRYDALQKVDEDASGGFGVLKSFIGKLDVIVSNPPYIAEKEKALMHKNVLDFEPEEALFVSDSNPILFYRSIADMAASLLYLGGRLYFEINPLFAEEVESMLKEKGFCNVRILKDLSGRSRFACAEK